MNHEAMTDLVLQFEDLTNEEKGIVQTHLAECSSCRRLLADLQAVESGISGPGPIAVLPPDPDGDPADGLRGEDLRQAQVSRTELLDKVRRNHSGRRRLPPIIWGGLTLAVAASLVFFLNFPLSGTGVPLVTQVSLSSPHLLRGQEAAALKAGDPYVVRFTLKEVGWPVIVALVPGRTPEVLHPRLKGGEASPADVPLVLPEVGSPVTWRLADPATMVWVALDTEGTVDPARLDRDLATMKTEAGVEGLLKDEFGNDAVARVALTP